MAILFAEYSSVKFTKVHVMGIRYIGFNQAEKDHPPFSIFFSFLVIRST